MDVIARSGTRHADGEMGCASDAVTEATTGRTGPGRQRADPAGFRYTRRARSGLDRRWTGGRKMKRRGAGQIRVYAGQQDRRRTQDEGSVGQQPEGLPVNGPFPAFRGRISGGLRLGFLDGFAHRAGMFAIERHADRLGQGVVAAIRNQHAGPRHHLHQGRVQIIGRHQGHQQ